MKKLELINEYIDRCNSVIASNIKNDAKNLLDEIISTFEPEISNIRSQLDCYSPIAFYSNHNTDYFGDIKLLRQKLINYSANIQSEQDKMDYELELARLKQPNISANAEAIAKQSVTTNFKIDINSTLEAIEKIDKTILSNEDKNILQDYIYSMEGIKNTKDKNKLWRKTKEVLKFLADKGADAAIASLPYIINALSQTNS